jgi:hypothetical protein
MKHPERNNSGRAALFVSIYEPRSTSVGSIATIAVELLPISTHSTASDGQGRRCNPAFPKSLFSRFISPQEMSYRRGHGDLVPLTYHRLKSDSFSNSLSSLSDAEKVIIRMKWPLNLAASATAFCLLPPTLDKESNTESLPSRCTEFRANLGLRPGARLEY